MPSLVILFIAGSLVIGRLEQRLGLVEAEQDRISKLNPVIMEIKKSVDILIKNFTKE